METGFAGERLLRLHSWFTASVVILAMDQWNTYGLSGFASIKYLYDFMRFDLDYRYKVGYDV